MKICKNCGAQLPDNANVCFRCKANVATPNAQPQARPNQPGPARQQNQYAAPNRPVNPQAQQNQNYGRPPVPQQPAMQQSGPYQQQQMGPGVPVPPAQNAPQPPKKKLSTGALIGIICGAVALVALIIGLSIFIFGGDKKDNDTTTKPSSQSSQETTNEDIPKELSIKKVGMTDKDISFGDGGIYYKQDGKYGLMSFDGKNDTGAKYTRLEAEGNYFRVSTNPVKLDENNIDTINVNGLADVNGNMIIPEEYAYISVINNRYAQVITATKKTTNEDNCVFFIHNGMVVPMQPNEDSIMYEGVWQLVDLKTGYFIKNIKGTKATNISANHDFINYYDDARQKQFVNCKNETVPDNWKVLSEGAYIVTNGTTSATAFSPDGEKLFDYNPQTDYQPSGYNNGRFTADKYTDDEHYYAVLDSSGKVISKEFTDPIHLSGELILSEGNIYNLKGDLLVSGDYSTLEQDEVYTGVYYISSSAERRYIDVTGDTIYTTKDGAEIDSTNILAYKKSADEKLFYCLKDKDYTIKAKYDTAEKWLCEDSEESGGYSLIEVLSGKTLLENCERIQCKRATDNTLYVYAQHDGDNSYVIYTVQ